MAWDDKNGKLSRFFAFKSSEAASNFITKLAEVAEKYDVDLKKVKLGDKAVKVYCPGNCMKSQTVSASIDACYRNCWESYKGTTKKAEHTKEAINLLPFLAAGGKKFVDYVAKPVSRPITWAGRKIHSGAKATAGTIRNNPFFGGYGNYAGARRKFIDESLRDAGYLRNARTGNVGTRAGAKAHLLENAEENLRNTSRAANRQAVAGSNIKSDYTRDHLNAIKDLAGEGSFANRLFTGKMFGLRGTNPLKKHREIAERFGDTDTMAAVDRRLKDISRNRLIGLGAGAGGLGLYGMATSPEAPKTPSWLSSIVNPAANFVEGYAPNIADLMRANPGLTAGAGGSALLLALYALMARNNN